ncbi:MAG TPA: HNH endonuclease [Lachnospiraceae bacterium]|nr:HNH endonuclease [Lachnospiraceae bacterium]
MAQEWAKSFYNSKKWQDCRKSYMENRILVDGGLCEECHEKPGHIVHHRISLTLDNIKNPEISLNHKNLEYVCKDCHDRFEGHGLGAAYRKTAHTPGTAGQVQLGRGIYFNEAGEVEQTKCFIVYGPPAGGKTTYVKEHKQAGDMIVDLDYIKQAISFEFKGDATDNLLPVALSLRECMYDLAAQRKVDCRSIWVVAGLPRRSERTALRDRLRAELIFIDTDYDECIRRSELDLERKDKEKNREFIRKWFAGYEK